VQKRYDDAVALLQQRYRTRRLTLRNLYDLAEALQLAGARMMRRKAFASSKLNHWPSRHEKTTPAANWSLLCSHAKRTRKALAIAEQEHAWRHDVYTLDALRLGIALNGQDAELASSSMRRWQLESAIPSCSRTPVDCLLKLRGIARPQSLSATVSLASTLLDQSRRACCLLDLGQAEMK